MEKFKVIFHPDNKTITIPKDTTILTAAISAGVYLKSTCAGDGVCGQCKVIVKSGKVNTQPTGVLSPEQKKDGVYLACLTEIQSDLEIFVPPESRLEFERLTPQENNINLKEVYSETEEVENIPIDQKISFKHLPLAAKIYLEIPPPDLDDKISDLERLYRQIRLVNPTKILQTGLANIRILPGLLRDAEWKITVTLAKRDDVIEITQIEPGDNTNNNFGLCFDIGTTTLTGQLVDLNTKLVRGTKIAYNRQAVFGSDVISRIIYAKHVDGLEKLHYAVTDEMNKMIHEFVNEHNLNLNDISYIVCAGNTTMIQLLLKIDPEHIRKSPYVPTANFIPTIRAAEAEINITPRGLMSCIPGISSYVGGDVTSGVLACGIDKEEQLSLLIDIGTNGEIVLGNKEFLVACAASAGPAFEGSGVNSGMRAAKGAIQKVRINPGDLSITFETIGQTKPRGICGSGYIDLISEMLSAGVIDKLGRIKINDNKRIRSGENGKEFIVVPKEYADATTDIVISEADIENIKRSKAAIYSATATLAKHMGISFSQIQKIFIAGGFGTYLDMHQAINIGLLPDLERSRFIFVGNSSLSGAKSVLLSSDAQEFAEEIARKITYFELSVEPGYMDEYMAALFFPHTDLSRFPSIMLKK